MNFLLRMQWIVDRIWYIKGIFLLDPIELSCFWKLFDSKFTRKLYWSFTIQVLMSHHDDWLSNDDTKRLIAV